MRGIRAFFISVLIVGIFAWVMSGCSSIERLANHPVVVRIAVSQAVIRYIERGDTAVDAAERRANVLAVMGQTLLFIDNDVDVNVDTILDVFIDRVDLDSMTIADQLLARETIFLVQNNLRRRVESGELSADTVLVLRDIVQTAIDAANYL